MEAPEHHPSSGLIIGTRTGSHAYPHHLFAQREDPALVTDASTEDHSLGDQVRGPRISVVGQ